MKDFSDYEGELQSLCAVTIWQKDDFRNGRYNSQLYENIWKILASNLAIVGTLDSRYGLEDECQDITFRIITTFDGRGRCVVVSFYLLPRLLKNCWYTMTPSTRQKLKYHTFFWSCLAFDLLEFFYSDSNSGLQPFL